jgi:hypothetical protein
MQYALNRRIARARVPMQVLRGFNPTEPGKLSLLAAPIDGQAIQSGMVIVRGTGTVNGKASQQGWLKAQAADSIGATGANEVISYFLALHDQDSHDVQASGGLVGLDCSDDYEVQTGYFVKSGSYVFNSPLTCGADGQVTLATVTNANILGYVTRVGSGANGQIPYVGKTPPTANAADAEVLQFKTSRSGQRKA